MTTYGITTSCIYQILIPYTLPLGVCVQLIYQLCGVPARLPDLDILPNDRSEMRAIFLLKLIRGLLWVFHEYIRLKTAQYVSKMQ